MKVTLKKVEANSGCDGCIFDACRNDCSKFPKELKCVVKGKDYIWVIDEQTRSVKEDGVTIKFDD